MSMLLALSLAAMAARTVPPEPPPPHLDAEGSLRKYEGCLWQEAAAKRGSAPLSTARTEATAAEAIVACRRGREEARRALLFERFSIERLETVESALAARLQSAAAMQAQPLPAENDIVIIGQKVRKIKFRIKLDKAGKVVCRITRSSGDSEIDALACDTARPCVRPDIVTKAAMTACLEPRWARLPVQIVELRRQRSVE